MNSFLFIETGQLRIGMYVQPGVGWMHHAFNDRYGVVVSVNSTRPLRPKVIVHDARVPKDEAPVLDLEAMPSLAIRRNLKPAQLPRDALDYLSPRQRICYFFERAVDPGPDEVHA